MAKNITKPIESPIGDLEWVIIEGEGKEDLAGNFKYQAALVLSGDSANAFQAEVNAFWDENKPAKIKEPKSLGYMPHKIPTGKEDEEGSKIYEETGKTSFLFKTGTAYADGNPKVITVFNAKGAEVSLGAKKIGNGSRGRVKGAIAIYTVEKAGKILQAGVTFYLNAIQLAKFVEYAGGPRFAAIEDEGDFEGVGDMGGIPDESTKTSESSDKPKL